ncbi:hypothetical protein PInf_018122 [Phytophthora infestans]|nr:hypothetical protein PInf_018122 [Phytophthora infestans]
MLEICSLEGAVRAINQLAIVQTLGCPTCGSDLLATTDESRQCRKLRLDHLKRVDLVTSVILCHSTMLEDTETLDAVFSFLSQIDLPTGFDDETHGMPEFSEISHEDELRLNALCGEGPASSEDSVLEKPKRVRISRKQQIDSLRGEVQELNDHLQSLLPQGPPGSTMGMKRQKMLDVGVPDDNAQVFEEMLQDTDELYVGVDELFLAKGLYDLPCPGRRRDVKRNVTNGLFLELLHLHVVPFAFHRRPEMLFRGSLFDSETAIFDSLRVELETQYQQSDSVFQSAGIAHFEGYIMCPAALRSTTNSHDEILVNAEC